MSKETLLWHPPSYSEPLAPGSTTAWHVTYRSPRATLLLRRRWNALSALSHRVDTYARGAEQRIPAQNLRFLSRRVGALPTETDRFVAPAAWTPLLSEKGRDSYRATGGVIAGRAALRHTSARSAGAGRSNFLSRPSERASMQPSTVPPKSVKMPSIPRQPSWRPTHGHVSIHVTEKEKDQC